MFLLYTILLILILIPLIRWCYITSKCVQKRRKRYDKYLKCVDITIGADLYPYLKMVQPFKFVPNLYDSSPSDGIHYRVKYVDTLPEGRSKYYLSDHRRRSLISQQIDEENRRKLSAEQSSTFFNLTDFLNKQNINDFFSPNNILTTLNDSMNNTNFLILKEESDEGEDEEESETESDFKEDMRPITEDGNRKPFCSQEDMKPLTGNENRKPSCSQISDNLRKLMLKNMVGDFKSLEEKSVGKTNGNGNTGVKSSNYFSVLTNNKIAENKFNYNETPVILCLHGVPGSYLHFSEFVKHFGHKYRILVPNFPDFSLTMKTHSFFHSTQERADFIKQFLLALNIKRINCLVCHSAGNLVASSLWSKFGEDMGIEIDSIILITPPQPYFLNEHQREAGKILVKIFSSAWMRNLFIAFWPKKWANKYIGMPENMTPNIDIFEMFWMITVSLLAVTEEELKADYEQLRDKKIPTMFVMAGRDGVFRKSNYFAILKILGVIDGNFNFIYDRENENPEKSWVRVVDFVLGGHFCHIKHSQVFHQQVEMFFNQIGI